MAKRKSKTTTAAKMKASEIAAIRQRLLDIYRGVCGTCWSDADTAMETGCVTNASDVGKYLAAIYRAFDVPADDFARALGNIETLIEFNLAAEFLWDRQQIWQEKGGA